MATSYSSDDLRVAVESSYSIAQVLDKLGLRAAGGNYATIKRRINRDGLSMDHFTGQAHNAGPHYRNPRSTRTTADILVDGVPYNSSHLRKRLLRDGLKLNVCERCLNSEWQGQPIPLELEHVNGKHDDNRLENLLLLCPNCHALTPTYRGRNIGR